MFLTAFGIFSISWLLNRTGWLSEDSTTYVFLAVYLIVIIVWSYLGRTKRFNISAKRMDEFYEYAQDLTHIFAEFIVFFLILLAVEDLGVEPFRFLKILLMVSMISKGLKLTLIKKDSNK